MKRRWRRKIREDLAGDWGPETGDPGDRSLERERCERLQSHSMGLELRGITKTYGTLRANDHIDLTIEEGTLHGLLGENGAGKSTLMKVVSGFIEADSGEISFDGQQLENG